MLKSIFSGVSGIRNLQTKIDVISNNIANVSTTGFKAARVNFQTQFSETLRGASAPGSDRGGTNPSQVGLGTVIGGIDTVMTQGTTQPTGKTTDLAISGEGFFLLSDGGEPCYTRDGNFDFDRNGTLVNPSTGLKVQGWRATFSEDGSSSLNTMDQPSNISIPAGQIMPPHKTSKIEATGNFDALTPQAHVTLSGLVLNSGDPPPVIMPMKDLYGNDRNIRLTFTRIDATTISYVADAVDSAGNPDPEVTVTMAPDSNIYFNSAGNPIAPAAPDVKINVTRATTPDEDLQAPPVSAPSYDQNIPIDAWGLNQSNIGANSMEAAINESTNGKPDYIIFGTKVIDGLGNSHMINIKATHTASDTWRLGLTYEDNNISQVDYKVGDNFLADITPGSAGKENYTAELRFDSATGKILAGGIPTFRIHFGNAGDSEISLNLENLSAITGENTATAGQDGYVSGILQGYDIDTNGVITGSFSNGQNQRLAQVALASFNNPGGLNRKTDNLFSASTNSGDPMIGAAGLGGRGKIQAGALEMANVDLATSFSELIVAQRAFQSNSRIVTVSDEILQEMMNMKR